MRKLSNTQTAEHIKVEISIDTIYKNLLQKVSITKLVNHHKQFMGIQRKNNISQEVKELAELAPSLKGSDKALATDQVS